VLGEERLAVNDHVEDAVISLDQGRGIPRFLLDLGRQTGGPRKIVSLAAVRDFDLHRRSGAAV
jgi:hypothetical protein